MLKSLALSITLPWCIIGDFNYLLAEEEKYRRVEHLAWLLQGFREVVMDYNIQDVELEGYPFIWTRSKGTP